MAKFHFKKETLVSPPAILIMYIIGAGLALMGFRFLFPGEAPPLAIFSTRWKLLSGLLEFIGLFPALIMAGLVVPFGFKVNYGDSYTSFSPHFLEQLKGSIISAVSAAALYGLLSLLVGPLAEDSMADMRFRGSLFKTSKEQAAAAALREEWTEAGQFIAVCENIWPGSPETDPLRVDISIKLDELRLSSGNNPARSAPEDTAPAYGPNFFAEPGRRTPVSAAEALEMADRAFAEERYYDAHWLATLAGRLAPGGSMETANAARLAGRAWNMIASLEPNSREERSYQRYHLKQSGYGAMLAEDWIRAYYIFKELSGLSPDDPDTANFLSLSERQLRELAFFTDEMELTLGDVLTGAVFSIPRRNPSGRSDGRLVIRAGSLAVFSDTSYGTDLECAVFDRESRLIYRVGAQYVKILPKTLDGTARLVILMRALDRGDREKRWEPEYTDMSADADAAMYADTRGSEIGNAQLMLDISYEELLLLVQARRGLNNFYIRDLFTAAKSLGPLGYIPQMFQVEIVRRIAEPAIFLSITILVLIAGWRFRAKKQARYMKIPMLGILPLVFSGAMLLFRSVLSGVIIWLVLSLGMTAALIITVSAGALLFILVLIGLAAQHG